MQVIETKLKESFPNHVVNVTRIDQKNIQVKIVGPGYSIGIVHADKDKIETSIKKLQELDDNYNGRNKTKVQGFEPK